MEPAAILLGPFWLANLAGTVWLAWYGIRRRDGLGYMLVGLPGVLGSFWHGMGCYAGAWVIWGLQVVTAYLAYRSLKSTRREANEQSRTQAGTGQGGDRSSGT